MKILYVIPARGGSKGVPYKNIKPLNGKPIIYYTIDVARQLTTDDHICISTDDDRIIEVVEDYGLKVPFKRPTYLATDTAGSYDVLLHTLSYYNSIGYEPDTIIMLQPTSPFRTAAHIKEALELYTPELDMVVSVKETSSNPYFLLFEENEDGFLHKSKESDFVTRQECPKVWEYNGAIYIINVESLKKSPLNKFKKVKKYVMDEMSSHDIDSMLDWRVAEVLLEK